MSEPRPSYGPPPATYQTVATYQIITGGEVANCAGALAVEARDALAAGTGRKTHQYREGASWTEIRTVRNRKGGKTYKYKYQVTVEGGKRKSKVIGRVGGE